MTMPCVPVRTTLATWLSLALLLAPLLAPAARAQDATGLDSISAEYHDLMDLFYRPLQPRDLLAPGWAALGSDATRHGAPQPPPLADLTDDRETAFDTFAAAYASYVGGLPASYSAETGAAAVNNAMADSVQRRDTHELPPTLVLQFRSMVCGAEQVIGQ